MRILSGMLLAGCILAGEADPLARALQLPDGDAFATDGMEQAISVQPVGSRRRLVERIAEVDRDDVVIVLHRMIQDEDGAAAAAAIDALAKRWPTSIQDAELIRSLIPRTGPESDAACRFAASINDDEALQALADRAAARSDDQPSELALRKLLGLPGGCGPDGWNAAVATQRDRNSVALDKAEKLLDGSQLDAIAAITLVAGMRPISSRATQILLRAAEHPDHTVRNSAASILSTCSSPPAMAWRKRIDSERADAAAAGTASEPGAAIAPPPAQDVVPAAVSVAMVASAPPEQPGSGIWIAALSVAIAVISGLAFWRMRRRKQFPNASPTASHKHITWAR